MIVAIGSILGFISVAFGAFAEHGLKSKITEEEFRFVMTALRYNQFNSAVIIAIGLFILAKAGQNIIPAFSYSAYAFILGTILFSFSIYISVLTGIKSITYVTPFGGIMLMAAWLMLAYSGFKMANQIIAN